MVRALIKTSSEQQLTHVNLTYRTATTATGTPSAGLFHSTVVGRSKMTDLSNDLLPRFGVERVMIQGIQEVQGETGPNGERVFKPINDQHDAVRIVGAFQSYDDAYGQYMQAPSADSTSYIEITFYGTGLNLLLTHNNTSDKSLNIVVDGGSNTVVPFVGTSGSTVLNQRNYSNNIVHNVVSGLSLGIHTVKIRGNGSSSHLFTGYEVLNTNSTLQYTPGSTYLEGKRTTSSLTTASYNSGFESGTLGTKGGCVLIYQKSDGTIAKALTPTDTGSPLYLTNASHTNEEVVRTYHWREFGCGRNTLNAGQSNDDFSSLTTTPSNRAFTLDDGTTTLVGSNVTVVATEGLVPNSTTNFWTLTFVGTGLDVILTNTGSGTPTYEFFVDGVSAGTINSLTGTRTQKVCSGLPYGTHTVKFIHNTSSTSLFSVSQFIVYAPKAPTLPSGAVSLGQYYLMADYANDTSSPVTTDSNSTGVLRKSCLREAIYSGASWLVDTFSSAVRNGISVYNTAATTDYMEYTFVGTGFNFNASGGTGGGATSWTFSLNGPGNTNWSSYTTSILVGGTAATWTAATGVLSVPTNASRFKLCVSGLPFGKHTVRLTKTSGAFASYVEGFDIITPVHTPAFNGPGVIQNTLSVGSCAIMDKRKFSEQQITPIKAWARAAGVASSPNNSGITSLQPIPDMSCTIKTSGNPVSIEYTHAGYNNTSINADNLFAIFINGTQAGLVSGFITSVSGKPITTTDQLTVQLAAGTHKVDVYWSTSDANATYRWGNRGSLVVKEL